jgi:16S rRNA G966 N2-methylase RsmD
MAELVARQMKILLRPIGEVKLYPKNPRVNDGAGENVLDLFGGSGSTLIAAEQTCRRAFLMELDALYCDVIVARWEKFAGRKVTRERDSTSKLEPRRRRR